MTPERWREMQELFHAAAQLPTVEREALLSRADPQLRASVEALLAQQKSSLEGGASLLETGTIATPGTQFGPYRIEGQIGAGGMGQVFRAIDTRLGRAVALKTCREQFTQRFFREAR